MPSPRQSSRRPRPARLRSAGAALCAVLMVAQVIWPLAGSAHLLGHHGHDTHLVHSAADEHAHPSDACEHAPAARITDGSTPRHAECSLCHLIAGGSPTLQLSTEAGFACAWPESSRAAVSAAHGLDTLALTRAMPRAPPRG